MKRVINLFIDSRTTSIFILNISKFQILILVKDNCNNFQLFDKKIEDTKTIIKRSHKNATFLDETRKNIYDFDDRVTSSRKKIDALDKNSR